LGKRFKRECTTKGPFHKPEKHPAALRKEGLHSQALKRGKTPPLRGEKKRGKKKIEEKY